MDRGRTLQPTPVWDRSATAGNDAISPSPCRPPSTRRSTQSGILLNRPRGWRKPLFALLRTPTHPHAARTQDSEEQGQGSEEQGAVDPRGAPRFPPRRAPLRPGLGGFGISGGDPHRPTDQDPLPEVLRQDRPRRNIPRSGA